MKGLGAEFNPYIMRMGGVVDMTGQDRKTTWGLIPPIRASRSKPWIARQRSLLQRRRACPIPRRRFGGTSTIIFYNIKAAKEHRAVNRIYKKSVDRSRACRQYIQPAHLRAGNSSTFKSVKLISIDRFGLLFLGANCSQGQILRHRNTRFILFFPPIIVLHVSFQFGESHHPSSIFINDE